MASENSTVRRLKKYEAEPLVLHSLGDNPRMDFLSPFGPLIGRTRLPEETVAYLNEEADRILTSGQNAEFQIPETICREGHPNSLMDCVARGIQLYVEASEGESLREIQFDVFWMVSQYAGTASPVHFHSGDLSGVAYLKVPEVNARQEQQNYISGRQAGYINFLIGGKQRFARSLISFKPVVGDLYIFPGWLLHGAEPFRGTGERRSLAFNASVP
ncbi:MAG: hypothetical protein JNM43_13385 [Planctomycetaceae bacterium]|nr:hypothetical protein [Planctomycetaceae bacterium]